LDQRECEVSRIGGAQDIGNVAAADVTIMASPTTRCSCSCSSPSCRPEGGARNDGRTVSNGNATVFIPEAEVSDRSTRSGYWRTRVGTTWEHWPTGKKALSKQSRVPESSARERVDELRIIRRVPVAKDNGIVPEVIIARAYSVVKLVKGVPPESAGRTGEPSNGPRCPVPTSSDPACSRFLEACARNQSRELRARGSQYPSWCCRSAIVGTGNGCCSGSETGIGPRKSTGALAPVFSVWPPLISVVVITSGNLFTNWFGKQSRSRPRPNRSNRFPRQWCHRWLGSRRREAS